jgi:hypothetical protein
MTDTNSSKELNAGGYLAAYFYRVPKKNPQRYLTEP